MFWLFTLQHINKDNVIAGRLGVVDYDEVELSNLHRQVLHTEAKVGVTKSTSVTMACRE